MKDISGKKLLVLAGADVHRKVHSILIAIWGGVSCLYMLPVWYFVVSTNNPSFLRRNGFFSLGYMLRDKERQRIVFITAVIVYILFCLIGFPSMGFHQNSAESPSEYVLFFFASVAGIIILNNLCRWISPHLSFSIFRWIGRNAMNLYVTHWIILMLLRLIVLDICQLQNTTLVFWIYLGTMVIALPLFNKTINSIKSCRKQSSIL